MVDYQERSNRNYTGAKVHVAHKKRKSRLAREPIETKISDSKKKIVRTRGANIKIKAYSANTVNVTDPKTKTQKIAKIKTVLENNASEDYRRRNIVTKGAIVTTDIGKVRITSRPGQCGQINGLLQE
jgi:small subunit ribosomal protein S8e